MTANQASGIVISFHANERMHERGITRQQVERTLLVGARRLDGYSRSQTYTYSAGGLTVAVAERRDGQYELTSCYKTKRGF